MSDIIVRDGITITVVPAGPEDDDELYDKSGAKTEAEGEAIVVADQYVEDYKSSTDLIDSTIATWQQGDTVSDTEMQAIIDLALELSPAEIQSLVPDVLTQDEADALIMVRGLALAVPPDTSTDAIQQGMINYYRLSDEDQAFAVEAMSSMTETHTYYDYDYGSSTDGEMVNEYSDATLQQQTVAVYLCGHSTETPVDHFQGCCDIVAKMGDAKAFVLAGVEELEAMTPEQRQEALDTLIVAAEPRIKEGAQNLLTALAHTLTVGKAALWFDSLTLSQQLCVTCGLNMGVLILSMHYLYAEEQSCMDAYTDYQHAAKAVDAALSSADGDDIDLNEITFTDHNGEEQNLVLWCLDQGVELPVDEGLDEDTVQEDEWYLEAIANPPDEYVEGVPDPPVTDEEKQQAINNDVYEMSESDRNDKKTECCEELYVVSPTQAENLKDSLNDDAQEQQTDMDDINDQLTKDNQFLKLYATIYHSTAMAIYQCMKAATENMDIFS